MPTPTKDNVVKMMEAFERALSEKDKHMLASMALEENQPPPPQEGQSSEGK